MISIRMNFGFSTTAAASFFFLLFPCLGWCQFHYSNTISYMGNSLVQTFILLVSEYNGFPLLFSKIFLNIYIWYMIYDIYDISYMIYDIIISPPKQLYCNCTVFCWCESTSESLWRCWILKITASNTSSGFPFSIFFIQSHKRIVGKNRQFD